VGEKSKKVRGRLIYEIKGFFRGFKDKIRNTGKLSPSVEEN